jgi:hypothetical protein
MAAATLLCTRPKLRLWSSVVGAAAVAPVLTVAFVFPERGEMPFQRRDALLLLGACVLFVVVVPAVHRSLRLGAAIYASACVVVFMVASPIGLNVGRYGQMLAAPLLVCAMSTRRRVATAMAFAAFVGWAFAPIVETIRDAHIDVSAARSYYQPLLAFLDPSAHPGARVEIPLTRRHWEAYYVARTVPLARGWERQLDVTDNPLFYGAPLDPNSYHAWLTTNRVRWVALPDAVLDGSSGAEALLLGQGLPYLRLAWTDAHWRVWEVVDARPFVDGPAQLLSFGVDQFTLDVTGPGPVEVGVRASQHWAVAGGHGCATSDGAWLKLLGLPRGRIVIHQQLVATPCGSTP